MVKRIILHVCKWLGLFHLSLVLTRRELRILCYHGFAGDDEASFRPRLFITAKTFEQRMKFLAKKRFRVLPLGQALTLMEKAELPSKAVVLTIDDGFAGVFERALPVLTRFGFPSTTYVTSYNVLKGTPVYRLVIQYLFWKTKQQSIDLSGLSVTGPREFLLRNLSEREQASDAVIEYGESKLNELERLAFERKLAKRLGIDFDSLVERRLFGLMTPAEIRAAIAKGMDIQLHTHRHRLPMDADLVAREIIDNRAALEPIAERPLHHLCYPSGIWARELWPWLAALQVESAMTCVPGLNNSQTPRLGLKRCLDGETVSAIEFEAELYGFGTLLRAGREIVRRVLYPSSSSRLAPESADVLQD